MAPADLQARIVGLLLWLLVGIGFCFGAAALARSRPPRQLWPLWGGSLILLILVLQGFITVSPDGQPLVSRLFATYMLGVFLGIPTAGALWTSIRAARASSGRSLIIDALKSAGVLVALLPVAALLAVVPDLVALFR